MSGQPVRADHGLVDPPGRPPARQLRPTGTLTQAPFSYTARPPAARERHRPAVAGAGAAARSAGGDRDRAPARRGRRPPAPGRRPGRWSTPAAGASTASPTARAPGRRWPAAWPRSTPLERCQPLRRHLGAGAGRHGPTSADFLAAGRRRWATRTSRRSSRWWPAPSALCDRVAADDDRAARWPAATRALLGPRAAALGWEPRPGEGERIPTPAGPAARPPSARSAPTEACGPRRRARFDAAPGGGTPLDPDLEAAVLAVVAAQLPARATTRPSLDRYRHPATPQEELRYLTRAGRLPRRRAGRADLRAGPHRGPHPERPVPDRRPARPTGSAGPAVWERVKEHWDDAARPVPGQQPHPHARRRPVAVRRPGAGRRRGPVPRRRTRCASASAASTRRSSGSGSTWPSADATARQLAADPGRGDRRRRPVAERRSTGRHGRVNFAVVATVFGLVAVAELPDKTMIATLVMGSRGRPLLVWLGASGAFAGPRRAGRGGRPAARAAPPPDARDRGHRPLLRRRRLPPARPREGRGGEGRARRREVEPRLNELGGWSLTAFGVILVGEFGDLTQLLTVNLVAHYHQPGVGVRRAPSPPW